MHVTELIQKAAEKAVALHDERKHPYMNPAYVEEALNEVFKDVDLAAAVTEEIMTLTGRVMIRGAVEAGVVAAAPELPVPMDPEDFVLFAGDYFDLDEDVSPSFFLVRTVGTTCSAQMTISSNMDPRSCTTRRKATEFARDQIRAIHKFGGLPISTTALLLPDEDWVVEECDSHYILNPDKTPAEFEAEVDEHLVYHTALNQYADHYQHQLQTIKALQERSS